MRKEWKQELDGLKLSDRQRARMKEAVRKPIVTKRRSYVPFVLPAFAALALLFFFVSNEPATPTVTTAAGGMAEKSLSSILWLTVSLILVMADYALLAVNLHKVKRWQRWGLAQKVKRYMFSWHAVWIVAIPLILHGLLWMFFLVMNKPNIVLQGFFTLLFLWFIVLVVTYFTKDYELATCPHCGHAFTRKELIKRSNKLDGGTCPSCQKKMYKIGRRNAGAVAFISPAIILLNLTDINMWYLFALFFGLMGFVIIFQTPYLVEYAKEQEEIKPLW